MTKPTKPRKQIAELIVDRVNLAAPEKLEGIDIAPVAHPLANWSPGVYWPPAVAGGATERILQNVVLDLQRQFDISD
ncbi:hypothetical protein [Bradyrhizobium retamae]|uniref:Uncharacterized protein n=1 Tax=Bradyrhizobium retamae TaxID=1300035 RepID=A0A0R3N822_9BRAD|nr:hypothetical protein [Bradyrhizobium retamae]KRR25936.1 hypothetical protein CQ13_23210 [Bradyrhizobium retamae]